MYWLLCIVALVAVKRLLVLVAMHRGTGCYVDELVLDFGFGLRYLLIWINLDMLSDFTWKLMFTGRACLNLVAM